MDHDSHTWLNAIIGAVVTIVFSFTMFSPILGGTAAGYLQRRDGVRVGALAGVLVAIPAVFMAFLFVVFFALAAVEFLIGLFLFLVLIVLLPIYIVGLSALGGYLGVYLRGELS